MRAKLKEREKILTLNDLWSIFVSKLLIIILAAVLVVGAAFVYNTLTFEAKYRSTATLYILRQNKTANDNEIREDFSLALNVVNDCTYLLKSHAVLDKVIDELKLDISYEVLSQSVTTNNPENTRILEVNVSSYSPTEAKRIVDSVCRIGSTKIMEAMGFNQVNLYENGTLEVAPYNKTGIKTYAFLGIIAAVFVYAIFLIAFLLDDRIRTDEDIENYLGLSVLGDIPNAYDSAKNRGGYYGKAYISNIKNRFDDAKSGV